MMDVWEACLVLTDGDEVLAQRLYDGEMEQRRQSTAAIDLINSWRRNPPVKRRHWWQR